MLDKRKIATSFSRASSTYDKVAVVQQAVLKEHLDRLVYAAIEPGQILDAGSGTGEGSLYLAKLYKKSDVYALDIASGMLHKHKKKLPRFRNHIKLICADLETLPFADRTMDMIFSNLAMQWCDDVNQLFSEFRRIMRVGGLLTVTSVGPDTLKELREAWAKMGVQVPVHQFLDMHDVGDALISNGFAEPVLDVDRYTLTYPDVRSILKDLQMLGSTYASSLRSRGLMSRSTLKKLEQAYEEQRVEGKLILTYEIVYAQAWVPEKDARPQDGSTVARFPLSALKRHHG